VRRRPTASRKPKKRLANPTHLKRSDAPKAARRRNSSKQTRDLAEALEQQAATAEILRVISSLPTDLERIFAVVAASATRLCDASDATIHQVDGAVLRLVAHHGSIRVPGPLPMTRGVLAGRAVLDRRTIHVADLQAETREYPEGSEIARHLGLRTNLAIPLIREGKAIGVVIIRRTEVRRFTERQIDLLRTFATQAVIAIENTRLFEAEQQRTRELSESLEQQTATSEVLRIISTSPSDTQPVFEAIVQSVLKLFPDALISVALRYGDRIDAAAVASRDAERGEAWRRTISRTPLSREYMHGAALLDCRIVDVPDAKSAPAEFSAGAQNFLTSGNRAITIMPMMRRNEAIGLLTVVRRSPGPLSDKQLSLLRTFAAQAVIAIENTRLLNELRQSLEQQTATAEVLRVISSSPGELGLVFQNLLDNATRLCVADFGLMAQYNGSSFQLMAQVGGDQDYIEYMQREPFQPGPETLTGRVLQARGPVQIEDFAKSKGYLDRDPLVVVAVEQGGVRTTMGVPMMRENELIGVIPLYRREVRLFTDKQIELLQNFAAQAVIAIENARLLNELRHTWAASHLAHQSCPHPAQRAQAAEEMSVLPPKADIRRHD
jgi:GAF domain-containing protein